MRKFLLGFVIGAIVGAIALYLILWAQVAYQVYTFCDKHPQTFADCRE